MAETATHHSMAAALRRLPDDLPEKVSLDRLLEQLGDKAIAFVLLVFAIPAIVPTPGIPAGMIFGTALAILALQIIFRARKLVLPGFLGRLSVSRSIIQLTADKAAPRLEKLETLLKPRGHFLARFAGPAFIGVVIFLMAILIALPIPFGNTLPGITVLVIALALAQRDDLALLGGLVLAVISVLFSIGIVYGGWALLSTWFGFGQPVA
ncbi:exopolysaccharide biosynthesis protein [Agrobacterium larrymoorei]|uniref:exopolysaccharide biosynthesis protein n=1 Tax=Agrobacterium larrymoorei TaxID=160699 RepID=UPI0015739681|nr:exopolysaccharide biosynthesis protein [Agrobacterium larrymoorei]NTJ42956.1 exopolysaccharide biosynthesis protein [Agrobacterium larrymoorei]